MQIIQKAVWRTSLAVVLLGLGVWAADTPRSGRRGAVATVQPLASQAAMDALQAGGNAVDAAVAAALMLGVVDAHDSGLGGGCFLVIHLADGTLVAIDGRETAPADLRPEYYQRDGRADPQLSQTGALAVGVPGELAALAHVAERYGRLPLRRALLAAARTAEEGFPIDAAFADRLADTAEELARFPEAKATFLRADGRPYAAGEILRQPALAGTLRAIAAEGIDWFYRGPFAAATEVWMRDHGGVLKAQDFADYRWRERTPVRTTYRGYEIIGFPPPSSGGVHVAQILNMVEGFDLRAMGAESADFVHVVAEAMKLAFADRAHWLGDPDFTDVPLGLVQKDYGQQLAARIDRRQARAVASHGQPPNAAGAHFGGHTTHFSTADAEGNWVACTATINTSFGAKVVVPGTGVVLNNEMDDFALQPGVPNAFGLVGSEANSVVPGKRPLSSMSPTLVLKDGKPVLSVGAAGGPTIITQAVLAIIHVIDFGRSPADALAQPRFHHQWRPDELRIEAAFPEEVREELARRGHRLRVVDELGAAQAVGVAFEGEGLVGAADPRGLGQALVW